MTVWLKLGEKIKPQTGDHDCWLKLGEKIKPLTGDHDWLKRWCVNPVAMVRLSVFPSQHLCRLVNNGLVIMYTTPTTGNIVRKLKIPRPLFETTRPIKCIAAGGMQTHKWRSRSTLWLSRAIRSVVKGNQWGGPLKSVLDWFHWYAPFVFRSKWLDRTTEYEIESEP